MSRMRARVWVHRHGWLWEMFRHDGGDPWVMCKRFYPTQREAFDAACAALKERPIVREEAFAPLAAHRHRHPDCRRCNEERR